MRFVKQKDAMQCGVACLSMICQYYEKKYTQKILSDYCQPTIEGVSLMGIKKGAEAIGFETGCYRMSLEELQKVGQPCIIHWDQNHFVVLYKISTKRNNYYVADPAKGKIKYKGEEFRKHWLSMKSQGVDKGIIMLLQPTDKFGERREPDRERHSIGFLLQYLKEYKKHLILICAGLLTGCLLQLIMPFLTQLIVDIGIHHKDIKFIWVVLAGELAIVIGRTMTDFIRRWFLLHISIRINLSLLSDFFIKLLKLPMSFFDTKYTGDIMQRMGDHSRIQSFLTDQILNVTFSMMSFVILGLVLWIYNALIFGIFIGCSIIYGLWLAIFLHRRKILDYELFACNAKSRTTTYQFITSMQEIKLQDCEQRRRWEWEDIEAELFKVKMKTLKLQQTQEAGSIFINEIKNILITVIAASAVIKGEISLGSMLAIQYIIGQLNSPVNQLMKFVYAMQDVKISLERINEVHETEEEENQSASVTKYMGRKDIEIKGIDFRYDKNNPVKVIDSVDMRIPEGKITAIVGASGSGKTTLLKLILGYYPTESGDIRIAGRNIGEYSVKWLRKQCGVVMQDGVIFSESIARNIAIDDNDIDIEKLERAAKIANIHDFIMEMPMKYNTRIGRDGTGLSQGQKQRILIARAVYKNPDYILLDEATNALDANNERAIVENLKEFYKGRTVIVVAHRLSTVKDADQIIVLDNGHVAEEGSHNELVKKKGLYHQLVKNQLDLGA